MHDDRRSVTLVLAVVWALATASAVEAFSGGISTLSFGAAGCNECHSGGMTRQPRSSATRLTKCWRYLCSATT